MPFPNFGRAFSLARFLTRPHNFSASAVNGLLNRQFSALVLSPLNSRYAARSSEKRGKNGNRQEAPPNQENKAPYGRETAGGPPKNMRGFAALMAISTGLSIGLWYYLYQVTIPVEVNWSDFEEILARGEVRKITVSQEGSRALVYLQSGQHIKGKVVFVS